MASQTVIPGRCEASNPESRDSGSGPEPVIGRAFARPVGTIPEWRRISEGLHSPISLAGIPGYRATGTRFCEVASSVCAAAFPHLPQAGAIHEMASATVRV